MSTEVPLRPPAPRIEAETVPAPRLVPEPPAAQVAEETRWPALLVTLGGVVMLVLGFALLSAGNFVAAQFDRAAWLGWLTLALAGAGFGLIGWGVLREFSGLRALARVDAVRAALAGSDVAEARAAALHWAAHAEGGPAVLAAIEAAPDGPAIAAVLRAGPAREIGERAAALGRQAAVEAFAATAISPSPAFDIAVFGWRGLRLIHQVAALCGLRPGLFGTLALLRRCLVSAATVAAADLAGQAVARAVLSHPALRHLGGEVAGAGMAARRMLALAQAACVACTPVTPAQ